MALTDPVTIPAGCGCCANGCGTTVCGQIPTDICLCLSGFTSPDPGNPLAADFNGCYTLHQTGDLTTGACPVWGYFAAYSGGTQFVGGTLSGSVPAGGFPVGTLTMNGANQLGTMWSNRLWSITPYCGSSDAGCVTVFDPNSLFNCSLSPPSVTISNSLWRFSIFNGSGYNNYYNQSGTATLTFGACSGTSTTSTTSTSSTSTTSTTTPPGTTTSSTSTTSTTTVPTTTTTATSSTTTTSTTTAPTTTSSTTTTTTTTPAPTTTATSSTTSSSTSTANATTLVG